VEFALSLKRSTYGNLILDSLPHEDLALFEGQLQKATLPVRKRLQSPDRKIGDIYFVSSGIVSVIATNGRRGKSSESGIIGPEGLSGIEVILADNYSQHEMVVQVAGHGHRLPAAALVAALDQSAALRKTLLRFASAFLIQVTETAVANATAKVDQRLARWLLMADDRLNGNAVAMTHDFLAIMLGVRRSGVTVAIRQLAKDGLVKNTRGAVLVLDRKGLADRAGLIYGRSRKELLRLLG
jgi:CRP-like cAMP-binding protein